MCCRVKYIQRQLKGKLRNVKRERRRKKTELLFRAIDWNVDGWWMCNTKALWSKCQNRGQYLYGSNECVCTKCWHGFSKAFYTWIYSSDSIVFSFFSLDSTRLNNSMMVSNSICGQHFIFFFFPFQFHIIWNVWTCVSSLSSSSQRGKKRVLLEFHIEFPGKRIYILYKIWYNTRS